MSINVNAKDNRDIINAIRKVSPPAHLPTYKNVPKKINAAIVILGVSLCIRFKLDYNLLFKGSARTYNCLDFNADVQTKNPFV